MIFGALGASPLGDDGVFLVGNAYVLTADVGLFSLAGQDAALLMARQLLGEAGVFTVAGQDVAFIVSTFSGAVFVRFARRKAVRARPSNAAAITGAQQTAQAVRARLTIRGDDRL